MDRTTLPNGLVCELDRCVCVEHGEKVSHWALKVAGLEIPIYAVDRGEYIIRTLKSLKVYPASTRNVLMDRFRAHAEADLPPSFDGSVLDKATRRIIRSALEEQIQNVIDASVRDKNRKRTKPDIFLYNRSDYQKGVFLRVLSNDMTSEFVELRSMAQPTIEATSERDEWEPGDLKRVKDKLATIIHLMDDTEVAEICSVITLTPISSGICVKEIKLGNFLGIVDGRGRRSFFHSRGAALSALESWACEGRLASREFNKLYGEISSPGNEALKCILDHSRKRMVVENLGFERSLVFVEDASEFPHALNPETDK